MKGTIICYCTFVLIMFSSCSSQKVDRRLANTSDNDDLIFDSHLHVMFENRDLLNEHLTEYLNSTTASAFVISPSYLVNAGYSDDPDNTESDPFSIESNRDSWNAQTAEIVRNYPSRLKGLCGIHWGWNDLSQVLNRCLLQKEMIGMKLRFDSPGIDGTERISNPIIFNRLSKALKSNPQVKVVLIHTAILSLAPGILNGGDEKMEGVKVTKRELYTQDIYELESILRLARKFPQINFVIAHSFNSSHMVKQLAKKQPPENVYIEVSVPYLLDTPQSEVKELYPSWKFFGMDRILYGTDIVLGDQQDDVEVNGQIIRLRIRDVLKRKFDQINELIHDPIDKNKIFRRNIISLP